MLEVDLPWSSGVCLHAVLYSLAHCLTNSGDFGLPTISLLSPQVLQDLLGFLLPYTVSPENFFHAINWDNPRLTLFNFQLSDITSLTDWYSIIFSHYIIYFVYFLVVSSGKVHLVPILQLGQGRRPNITHFDWVKLMISKTQYFHFDLQNSNFTYFNFTIMLFPKNLCNFK